MANTPSVDTLAMIHLMMLSLWGGVVATEAVIEVLPFRRAELHNATIRLHFWIDLLVELPLVIAVACTGAALLYLTADVTGTHLVKVAFGTATIAINIFCICVVFRRARLHARGAAEAQLWPLSRVVLACFVVGLAFAAVAATLGFRLAFTRMTVTLTESFFSIIS